MGFSIISTTADFKFGSDKIHNMTGPRPDYYQVNLIPYWASDDRANKIHRNIGKRQNSFEKKITKHIHKFYTFLLWAPCTYKVLTLYVAHVKIGKRGIKVAV